MILLFMNDMAPSPVVLVLMVVFVKDSTVCLSPWLSMSVCVYAYLSTHNDMLCM